MDTVLLVTLIGVLALVVYREFSAIQQLRRFQEQVDRIVGQVQEQAAEASARLHRGTQALSDQIAGAAKGMAAEHEAMCKTMHKFTTLAGQIDGTCVEAKARVRAEVDAALARLPGPPKR